MMIKDRNLFDLREQSLIDLLYVRSGQRARLAGGEDRQSTNHHQKQLGYSIHEISVPAEIPKQVFCPQLSLSR